jgi:hypothetical protein
MRFASLLTVDRHGLRPRDDKVWKGMGVCSSIPTRSLSLRGKSGAKDAAIHCMQWTRTESAVRSPTHSGSPRAFSPRDDKVVSDE